MIKWTFFFDEGNVSSEVTEEKEDERITDFVGYNTENASEGDRVLYLKGEKTDMYVNLKMVKLTVRQEIDDTAEAAPIPA